MIERLLVYEAQGTDPYENIATEKYLLEHLEEGSCVLYLWQNKNTVVIGRNQNAWAECRTSLLEQEGGRLARRLSGGGAVYHDLGNLNFTFLVNEDDYDVDRQLSVIQTALAVFGLNAEKSGRNDLLVEGRKFSGNAFFHRQGHAYHHGTLLVNADLTMLSRYLTPPKAKLESKGISSVRSRVANLTEFLPSLTCQTLAEAMKDAFCRVYGLTYTPFSLPPEATEEITASASELSSWDWLYGPRQPFSFQCEARFLWGYLQLQLQVESGHIQQARAYSDAMDWQLADNICQSLTGCRFHASTMQDALRQHMGSDPVCQDLCDLLEDQQI